MGGIEIEPLRYAVYRSDCDLNYRICICIIGLTTTDVTGIKSAERLPARVSTIIEPLGEQYSVLVLRDCATIFTRSSCLELQP